MLKTRQETRSCAVFEVEWLKTSKSWRRAIPHASSSLGSGGDFDVGDCACRDVIALSSRQPAQIAEHKESSRNNDEGGESEIAEHSRREIKKAAKPPHGPPGKLRGNHRPHGNVKPAL